MFLCGFWFVFCFQTNGPHLWRFRLFRLDFNELGKPFVHQNRRLCLVELCFIASRERSNEAANWTEKANEGHASIRVVNSEKPGVSAAKRWATCS